VTGASSNREAVTWAIDDAIAIGRKQEAVRRILSHHFAPDHFDNPPAYEDVPEEPAP
jgi:hypothetical protein